MNKFINKGWITFILLLILNTFLVATDGEEEDRNLCAERGVVFGFFNGVQTTRPSARYALSKLKRTFGTKTEEDEQINYELFYNYTNGFEDFVETFEQRLYEQNGILAGRYELFFQVLHQQGSWWDKITTTIPALLDVLGAISDQLQASAVRALSGLTAEPSAISTYVEHRTRLDSFIIEGKKLLLFAHSQGNLFVNVAYDYAVSKVSSESVKVVHVAPASPSLRGAYTLANVDLVINGLRIAGSVPSITTIMPGYLQRPVGINGRSDILGHGLLEIYLNPHLNMLSRIRGHVNTILDTLVEPEVEGNAGFFTATLTWDGVGDVDLHVFEPSINGGEHVYYSNKQGKAGELDVDNTSGFGPEHYYGSCDESKLLVGRYEVALANYARAKGRTASIQIASWKEGVLGTKSYLLGDDTGDIPECPLFDVRVNYDVESEKYSVEIGNDIGCARRE